MIVLPDGVVDAVFLAGPEDELLQLLSPQLHDVGGRLLLSREVRFLRGGCNLHLLEDFGMGLPIFSKSFMPGLESLLWVVSCSLLGCLPSALRLRIFLLLLDWFARLQGLN
jgi:hypothetical protein